MGRGVSWLGTRVAGALCGLPAAGVLGIARWLDPSPAGVGTHTQLGLGRCPVLALTGFPCPMCGMTTTFALMADLRPVDAVLNQPFGVFLCVVTATAAAVSLAQMVTGKPVLPALLARILHRERLYASLLLIGMIGGWVYKMAAIRGWAGA